MTEAQVERAILVALSARSDVRLFRNSVGRAVDPSTGAYVQFGLCVGSSDLVGVVAPHGRFLALEVKSATGRPTPAQSNFVAMVNAMGGIGRVVRSVAEALAALDEAAR